jgi:hypothetical protein
MKEVMMNFKIRVVENIGEYSEEIFGPVGFTHTVHKGGFHDLNGNKWSDGKKGFSNTDEINKYFADYACYNTVFALVEEEPDEDR